VPLFGEQRDMSMYKHIMITVDLTHIDKSETALAVVADLAKHYDATVTYGALTSNAPGALAHNPEEFARKLMDFATEQGAQRGHRTAAHSVVSPDPAVDLDKKLAGTVDAIGADLIVMATHIPNMADMLLPSHGGALARHTGASVFLVRTH
jgi:nucleotide-binding universal stress UspA family protein